MPARPTAKSDAAFARASQLMPGGVSSPVRAFKGVGGNPPFISQAKGCRITDIDGNTYVDYVGSYGPMIVGHAHEAVGAAICRAAGRGTSFGAPSEGEIRLAELITGALPAVEMVRFVNSGTEAAMSAIRLARAATGRDLVVKCVGCYHGHVDGLLVNAGSGRTDARHAESSPGVPAGVASATVSVAYNDLAAAPPRRSRNTPARSPSSPSNRSPATWAWCCRRTGYLQGLRDLCDRHGTLLLFDEVMSGFRVAWAGMQGRSNVRPDLVCLGKVIGGGLPVGAYGGRRALMERVSPSGPVYQAGTLSGNPLAMAAGETTLALMQAHGAYETLEATSVRLADGLTAAAAKAGVPVAVNVICGMVCPFFVRGAGQTVVDYATATACDTARYATFFHAMLDEGVYLPPSQYEAWFPGLAHDAAAVDLTLAAAEKAFAAVAD